MDGSKTSFALNFRFQVRQGRETLLLTTILAHKPSVQQVNRRFFRLPEKFLFHEESRECYLCRLSRTHRIHSNGTQGYGRRPGGFLHHWMHSLRIRNEVITYWTSNVTWCRAPSSSHHGDQVWLCLVTFMAEFNSCPLFGYGNLKTAKES